MIEHTHPVIGEAEQAALERVLTSGQLAQGGEVASFEAEFAAAIGVPHAVAVANGTVAIEIALQALGIGPGDEVVVPSFTFIATANAVRRVGATPVFADIDPKTFCLDAATVEPHLGPRTRAVIAVHLYGHPADLHGLQILADQSGIHLVEDTAQGIGASWNGRSLGSFGSAGTFSFYATKNITTGEGGMVTTSDQRVAENARMLRAHQSVRVGNRLQVGTNARLTDVAAAMGRAQLSALDGMQRRRAQIASVYDQKLTEKVTTPYVAPGCGHGYHQYTIRTGDRDAVVRAMVEAGVGHAIYYPTPVHLADPYRDSGLSLPDTEAAAKEVISLPVRPDLTAEEQDRVIAAVNRGAGR